jgi:hypothetical protein
MEPRNKIQLCDETNTKGNRTYGYSNICVPDFGRLAFSTPPGKRTGNRPSTSIKISKNGLKASINGTEIAIQYNIDLIHLLKLFLYFFDQGLVSMFE